MVFLNDGSVDSIQTLLATGEDSNGKKLNFKQNKDGGYQAEGTDGKLYSIDLPEATAKVSVSAIPEKKEIDYNKMAEKKAEADSKKK